MQIFKQLEALIAPLDRPNVDTDAIIPKQYLKSIKRTGFGEVLFDEWRYLEAGKPGDDHAKRKQNPDFVLNLARYQGAEILLARENFGCGSSREHAPWALQQYGFKAILAPSFADIFFSNSFKNGILLITLDAALIDELFKEVVISPGYKLNIDLALQRILRADGSKIDFMIEPFLRHRLLNGLDDIGLTLEHTDEIKAYEIRHRREAPWLF